MVLRDISFLNPAENILFDEVLLRLAEDNKAAECLRFWESPSHFIVLGRTSDANADVHCERAQKDGIPVLRRSSGGGTVVQGPGCLNFSSVLSKDSHPDLALLRKSYQHILGKVIGALKTLSVDAVFYPVSDLAIGSAQKKISGNAQKRGRKFILHHGTILYQFDLSVIDKYIKNPKSVPEYRQNRPHNDFVTNIGVACGKIKKALKSAFQAEEENHVLTIDERELLDTFLHSKEIVID